MPASLELHCHRLAVSFTRLKELPRLEAEHARQNICGERLDLRVQVTHHRVVVAAGVLDGVFGLAQRSLQLREFLRGLQLRVILSHSEQTLQRASELILCSRLVC